MKHTMLLFVGCVVCNFSTICAQTRDNVSLPLLLERIGDEADCYFTIEVNRARDARKQSELFDWDGPPPEMFPTDVAQVQVLLLKLFPDIRVESRLGSRVVQIYERGISRDILSAKADLKYSGQLWKLPDAIGNDIAGISSQRSFSTKGYFRFPDSGPVTIDAAGTVRALLTEHIPLMNRRRILWCADLSQRGDDVSAKVSFGGPAAWAVIRGEETPPPDVHHPFAKGQMAFAFNTANSGNQEAARQFVEKQFASKKPHQVRWAMFFLGRTKDATAVPLLLKHLDYHYSVHGVPEDAYPALLALKQIGEPAAVSALQQLTGRDSHRKTELMCRLIIAVFGDQEADAKLKTVVDRLADAKQRALVENAIKVARKPFVDSPVATGERKP